MSKKEFTWFVALFSAVLFLATPDFCTESRADNMEILEPDIAIGATIRHEWFPFVEYNPIDNNFMAVWHTGGKLEEDDTLVHFAIEG